MPSNSEFSLSVTIGDLTVDEYNNNGQYFIESNLFTPFSYKCKMFTKNVAEQQEIPVTPYEIVIRVNDNYKQKSYYKVFVDGVKVKGICLGNGSIKKISGFRDGDSVKEFLFSMPRFADNENDRVDPFRTTEIGKIKVECWKANLKKSKIRMSKKPLNFIQANKKDSSNVTQGKYFMATSRAGKSVKKRRLERQIDHWQKEILVSTLLLNYRMSDTLKDMGIKLKPVDWTKPTVNNNAQDDQNKEKDVWQRNLSLNESNITSAELLFDEPGGNSNKKLVRCGQSRWKLASDDESNATSSQAASIYSEATLSESSDTNNQSFRRHKHHFKHYKSSNYYQFQPYSKSNFHYNSQHNKKYRSHELQYSNSRYKYINPRYRQAMENKNSDRKESYTQTTSSVAEIKKANPEVIEIGNSKLGDANSNTSKKDATLNRPAVKYSSTPVHEPESTTDVEINPDLTVSDTSSTGFSDLDISNVSDHQDNFDTVVNSHFSNESNANIFSSDIAHGSIAVDLIGRKVVKPSLSDSTSTLYVNAIDGMENRPDINKTMKKSECFLKNYTFNSVPEKKQRCSKPNCIDPDLCNNVKVKKDLNENYERNHNIVEIKEEYEVNDISEPVKDYGSDLEIIKFIPAGTKKLLDCITVEDN